MKLWTPCMLSVEIMDTLYVKRWNSGPLKAVNECWLSKIILGCISSSQNMYQHGTGINKFRTLKKKFLDKSIEFKIFNFLNFLLCKYVFFQGVHHLKKLVLVLRIVCWIHQIQSGDFIIQLHSYKSSSLRAVNIINNKSKIIFSN